MNINELDGIRTVLFDAGNTLIFPDYPFISEVLKDVGVDADVHQLRENEYLGRNAAVRSQSSKPWKPYFGTWFRSVGVSEKILPQVFDRLWERHRRKNLWNWIESGTEETLQILLENGLRLGVISNSDGRLREQFEDLGLSSYFEVLVDSEVVGVRKPDPAIFELALERLGVNAAESLYVGDTYQMDVMGARSVGMKALLVDPFDNYDHCDCPRIARCQDVVSFFQNVKVESKYS